MHERTGRVDEDGGVDDAAPIDADGSADGGIDRLRRLADPRPLTKQALADLRRVSWGNVIVIVLVLALVVLVVSNAGELEAIVAEMQGAAWGWVVAAFLVGLLAAFTGG